jgi:hypothetical protein
VVATKLGAGISIRGTMPGGYSIQVDGEGFSRFSASGAQDEGPERTELVIKTINVRAP